MSNIAVVSTALSVGVLTLTLSIFINRNFIKKFVSMFLTLLVATVAVYVSASSHAPIELSVSEGIKYAIMPGAGLIGLLLGALIRKIY